MMNFSFNNVKLALGGILMAALAFTGCLKKSDVTPPTVSTYVSVLHLAPTSPAVEVYANNVRESTSMPVGSYFSYYLGLEPGLKTFQFKKTSSDSLVASLPIDNYDSLNFYTFVLYNDPAQPTAVKVVSIYDDFTTMQSDKASYRFFNMSPDAGTVNFYIDDVKVSSGRTNADIAYGDYYTQFQKTTPGSYTIKAKLASNDSLLAQVSAESLAAANAYTIFLKGLASGTGDKALKLTVLRAVN